ncbi:MAG: class I SAM-dependent methyltransferase [Lentisphaeraceae bacterium]|nr:class I SAM-dependent methyltransferase [Lentisphaeraceae bacterium]
MFEKFKYLFIKKIYGDHNSNKCVIRAINKVLDSISENGVGLNVGAGKTDIDKRIKKMELAPGNGIDYVGSVENIPEKNDFFDVVISQEVLEHVKNPWKAISEIQRVLKKGGLAYIQLPFTIGFHPCPNDYWRFSQEGIEELIKSTNMEIVERGISAGSATGFYRISVEFFAILFSLPIPPMYKFFKALVSLLLYPVKLLDPIMNLSNQKDRICGGYFIICRK